MKEKQARSQYLITKMSSNRLFKMIWRNPLNLLLVFGWNIKTLSLKLRGYKTIVYNIQMDYFYNTFEPVYKQLKKNNKVVVFFAYFEGMQKLKKYLQSFLPCNLLLSSTISPYVYFDMFITAEINGPDFPLSFFNTHKIQLYHGIGVVPLHQKINVLSLFNTHFALGSQLVEFLEKLPHEKKNQNSYAKVGFPKLDSIVHPDPDFVDYLKDFYNIKDQFVIVYAPHWNIHGSLHNLSLKFLDKITQLENVIILIKVHNFLHVKFKKDNWHKRISDYADSHNNVIYVSRPNTQELFPLADMLITDAITTTAFEFCLTYKPVFAYSCSGWFESNSHAGVEKEMKDMSIIFDNAADIYNYTRQLIEKDETMMQKIARQQIEQKQLTDKYLFHIGNSTEAAVKEIEKILNISPSPRHRLKIPFKNRFICTVINNPLVVFSILSWNCKGFYYKLTGKKIIIYNIQYDYFFNIFETVYNKLKKHKNILIFFSFPPQKTQLWDYLNKFILPQYLISSQISPYFYSDLFITAEINGPDFPSSIFPTRKIQMYHGTGVYPLYNKTNVLSRFNLHFAVGPQFVKFIKTLPHHQSNLNEYARVGYPKLDSIIRTNQKQISKLKSLYDIDKQFVILYTPHWNPDGSLHQLGFDMIHRLSSLPNVLILIKVHNFLFSRYKEENWEQKFYDFCQNHPNVKYIKEPDTQSIFPLGDMMITDTGTTAAFEFSLTYKPVFIYCSQSWFDKFNDVDVEVEKKLTEMALCFENIDQIYVFAQKLQNKDPQILANLELQKEQQKKLIDQYLFNPGSATAEAIKIIMKELKLNDRKP